MEYRRPALQGIEMAALAHDLRTPMCVAAGAAQMALEAGGRDVSAQLREILLAVNAMDRMLAMMSSAPDTQKGNTFTARQLSAELLAMTAGRAQQKGQTLSVDLSTLDGMQLKTDYAALCRLLTNLLGNAVKYTPPGGEITLRAQGLRMRRREGRVRFVIADNGIGMTRTFMGRMFQPFARAQEAEGIPGSGLGLSIAKDMVRRLGGTIRVRSERGRGTTFVVCVPVEIAGQGRES